MLARLVLTKRSWIIAAFQIPHSALWEKTPASTLTVVETKVRGNTPLFLTTQTNNLQSVKVDTGLQRKPSHFGFIHNWPLSMFLHVECPGWWESLRMGPHSSQPALAHLQGTWGQQPLPRITGQSHEDAHTHPKNTPRAIIQYTIKSQSHPNTTAVPDKSFDTYQILEKPSLHF